MTFPARRVALAAAAVLLCAPLTTACGAHRSADGSRQPSGSPATASVTVAPDPSATDIAELARILDDAQSAAAAAESDAADGS